MNILSFKRSSVALLACLCILGLPRSARADGSIPGMITADSVSGQFVVVGSPTISPLASLPDVATNQQFVRLDPPLLAVSAERIKNALLRKLGVNSDLMQGGTIFLTLKPASALDEDVAVFPTQLSGHWVYHVVLPDILPRERLARALTSVILMDYANRYAGPRLAQAPPWLVEGFSRELLAETMQDVILSVPDEIVNSISVDPVSFTKKGMDPLASMRAIFDTYSILTFQQLSWPTDLELSDEDSGVYRASAQLFVDQLLDIRNGPAKMRALLDRLPRFYNWQTSFFSAFHQDFRMPLDVEKWWALQTVIFAANVHGPQWTPSFSREKLDQILSVAADFRSSSNSMPVRAEVSLQDVIKNFDSETQSEILTGKLHDLEVAQFRMSRSMAILAAEYR
ncbi:MAG: hypothetical protein ACREE6_17605, partial [Limisphaerales bacterium]